VPIRAIEPVTQCVESGRECGFSRQITGLDSFRKILSDVIRSNCEPDTLVGEVLEGRDCEDRVACQPGTGEVFYSLT